MEKLLREAWRIPMSAYLIVNEDEFLELIDQLRTAIPKEIRQADRILQERDRAIALAESEGEQIRQQAREDAAKLVEESEIISAANQRAQTIVERAHRDAETLKTEADAYAGGVLRDLDSQLGTLEGQIGRLTSIVRNGLETLSKPPETEPDQPQ
jgi:cell division septum initiation protein DivIVA